MRPVARLASFVACSLFAVQAYAGFASTETFLAAVGNPVGAGGAHFLTTAWITDVSSSPVTFTFQFLRSGQANNVSPTSFSDTLQPGQTKMYTDVVASKLGLTNVNGAARITANGELFVSERIFNQPAGTALAATAGQFFSGIPKAFSIGLGQTTSLQGVYVGSGKDFRYNYVLLETSGANCSVHVRLLNDAGVELGAGDFLLLPYEHLLLSATALSPSASSDNARLTATVTSGSGTAMIAGSQVGNSAPQDQTGYEMSFLDEILSSGGGGVTSLNGLTGAVTLSAGSNVTLGGSGNNIVINATGGGSGGGLTLPYSGSAGTSGVVFSISNTSTGVGIEADAINQPGVYGVSVNSRGVYGDGGAYGVYGESGNEGVHGQGGSTGVFGHGAAESASTGVYGEGRSVGVDGYGLSNSVGVQGQGGIYGVLSAGNFVATGSKSFIEPHPTDPEKEIRFVCLEGPESGTYFRGSARTVNGIATIEVPESFRMVTDDQNLTVVLAPMGELAILACTKKSLDQIVIQSSKDVAFDYVVNGVRKAFRDHEAISENKDFIPRSAADPRFTIGLPPESIRRLIASGILNPDGTINLETARRLGWDQRESWKRAEAEADRVAATQR